MLNRVSSRGLSPQRSERRWCAVALAVLAGVLACASSAAALLRPLELPQEVAVVRSGVVWVAQGRVLFQGFWSGSTTLGGAGEYGPTLASSGGAVALVGGAAGGFAAAVPPGHFAPVEQTGEEALEVHGGECTSWAPVIGSGLVPTDFAVAGDDLVDAGECQGENGGFKEQELATSQPLFVRSLRGGNWRVLRWLAGHNPPILATEGRLLAIGVQLPLAKMRVTILDLGTGQMVGQFDAPDGDLSFASSRRLVLSVQTPPEAEGAHLAPATDIAQPLASPRIRARKLRKLPSYRIELYSLRGRHLADLGTAAQPPLVSHMHLVERESVEGNSVLVERSVLGGASRRLIGFNEPARNLVALAFRWPAVAVVETTSAPLSQSEVTCTSGEYHHPSAPFLAILDLARAEPFVPPPPSADLVRPAQCPRIIPPKYWPKRGAAAALVQGNRPPSAHLLGRPSPSEYRL
jgi:hypothetical protein